ncbi:hypothetical protein ACFOY4_06580 [Actinomadura syzygii]|uniref:Lipoprotein n=1 Tax=Actinomadura syzygii TaxID=1427538 RepID=A0A5D0TU93_9ACTN|nr:hypothetical protein [Actinomadura syzygii]TYC09273.1 hypothetical protein FXF65_33925 [Actinomadura syzygii]
MRVRVLFAVVFLFAASTACGGEPDLSMPPLTPEPGDSRLVGGATRAAPADTFPARLALYKYLRGVAVGNVRACTYLTPEFERAAFGRAGGCRAGFLRARAQLRPQDVAALRGVTVPACEDGPADGEYTVRFEQLKWAGEPARPGGLLAAAFTLRKTGPYWQLAPYQQD